MKVRTLEEKYVFPLDDKAAVCGFEAFINGKHIVGEVSGGGVVSSPVPESLSLLPKCLLSGSSQLR